MTRDTSASNEHRDSHAQFCEGCPPEALMDSPTPEEQEDPLFESIFQAIKDWEIEMPSVYSGICSGNGSHALLIYRKIHKDAEEKLNCTLCYRDKTSDE